MRIVQTKRPELSYQPERQIQSRSRASVALNLESRIRVHRGANDIKKQNHKIFGAPPGTRTLDPLIKSQLLYQLS